jgi:hypothetical protein
MRFTAGIQATFTVYEDASSASPTSRSPKGGRGGGIKIQYMQIIIEFA